MSHSSCDYTHPRFSNLDLCEVPNGDSTDAVNLEAILKFATGVSEEPPLRFTWNPSIMFVATNSSIYCSWLFCVIEQIFLMFSDETILPQLTVLSNKFCMDQILLNLSDNADLSAL